MTPTRDVAIRATDLRKVYRLYAKPAYRFLDMFGLLGDRPGAFTEHAALDGINLEIRRGEKVAIIGRNGAGKSTFLKLVTNVIQPTAGSLEVKGDVHALLQIGTGFHPGLHRPPERLCVPRATRRHRRGGRPALRRCDRLRRARGVHRSTGEDLLDRHGDAADVFGLDGDLARPAGARRSARRRRRLLRAEELRPHARALRTERRDAAARHPRHLFRGAGCATA